MKLRAFVIGVILSGCVSQPFQPVPLVPAGDWNPAQVVSDFEEKIAADFRVSESGLFLYKGHEFSALSYTQADSKARTVVSTGLSPLGMKVFDIRAGVQGVEDYSFSIPQIKNKIDPAAMASAMGEDLWRIYMGRVPARNAEITVKKDRLIFRTRTAEGTLEHVFGGENAFLLEKRFLKGRWELWSVKYFQYRVQGDKLYPSQTFYRSRTRGYSLTLNLKEIFA